MSAGAARKRAGLVTLDQILSSISNLAITLVAAHALLAIDFGRFSLILLIYGFALGPTRAVISVPVLIYPDDADNRPWAVLGSAMVLSVWGGVLCVAAGALLVVGGSTMGPAVLVLGLLLPMLQIQDIARFVAISRSKPIGAVLLDGSWVVFMVVGFVIADRLHVENLVSFILVWGGSGALACFWIFAQYGFPRRHELTLDWLKDRWDFSWRSLVANVANTGGALAGALFVSVVSSPIAVAAVRAALLLARPSAAVQTAVSSAVAAEVARNAHDDVELRRQQRRALLIGLAIGVLNLAVLLVIPNSIGAKVLGHVWPLIKPLILAIGLYIVANAGQSGVRAVLLGRHQISLTMVADIAGAILSIFSLVIGAVLDGARGAVWSLVVGQALTSAWWWGALLHYQRRDRRRPRRGKHRAIASVGSGSSSA